MAIVGPGAQQLEQAHPEPLLNKASEFEYVTILNPLTDDFMVRVAQDIPVNVPFEIRKDNTGKTAISTTDERMATLNYGLNLKNPDHQANKRVYNEAVIPAGKTMNFKGNDAQVVVRQLVNEILQREGKKRFLADPNVRLEVENRIVISRGSVQDILDQTLTTPRSQIDAAIKNSNQMMEESTDAFAGLEQATEGTPEQGTVVTKGSGTAQSNEVAQPKRTPGRPKSA